MLWRQIDFQLGNGGQRLEPEGAGLIPVEFALRVHALARLGDAGRVFLDFRVGLRVADALFVGAKNHVIGRHVGEQRDEDVVVIVHRGVEAGGGGFDLTAESPPEIQLPGEAETVRPLTGITLLPRKTARGFAAAGGSIEGAEGELRLGEDFAARDAELGARLQDAEAGFAQRQVLLVGGDDQLIEG